MTPDIREGSDELQISHTNRVKSSLSMTTLGSANNHSIPHTCPKQNLPIQSNRPGTLPAHLIILSPRLLFLPGTQFKITLRIRYCTANYLILCSVNPHSEISREQYSQLLHFSHDSRLTTHNRNLMHRFMAILGRAQENMDMRTEHEWAKTPEARKYK